LEEVKREIKGIHWVYWAAVVAVVAIIANLSTGILGIMGGFFGCIYGLSDVFMPFTIAPLAALLPLLAYPFVATKRLKVSLATLARLYLVGLVVAYTIGNWTDVWKSIPVGNSLRVLNTPGQLGELLRSLWFVPPMRVLVPLAAGNVVTDWGAWAPAIIFSFLYGLAFFLPSLSLSLLFRRRWIDIEKLPFPTAIGQWEAVRGVYSFGGEARSVIGQVTGTRTPLIIGIIVGLVFNVALFMTNLFPWWPDVLGWRALGTSPNGCVNVPVGSLYNTIVAFGRWNEQPLNYVIAYLAPLNVIFSYWFCTLIFMILAQISYYFGYYTGFETVSGCCRLLGGYFGGGGMANISPWWGPPIYWSWMVITGGMLAFVIMTLWHAKDYLAETFRAARGKAPPEVQAREPLSYRTIYIMLIASYVIVLAFLSSIGISIGIGFIVLVFGALIFPIAEAYAYGLTGVGYAQGRLEWATWSFHFIWPTAPTTYTVDFFIGGQILARGTNVASSGLHTWSMVCGHGFKISDMTGLSTRETTKLIVMAFLIGVPISLALRVWFSNTMGASRIGNCISSWECDCLGSAEYNTAPSPSVIAGAAGAGFIITSALFIATSRWVWFPIHPMGFLLTGGFRATWTGAWTNFLGAWVAKWLTLRIGGSKAYTEYGIPFVGGYIIGLVIMILAGIIIGTYRWYIPF
jgi:hypothetical protein